MLGEDAFIGQTFWTEIEIAENFAHHHIQLGQHRARDQRRGARAQVEETFRCADQLDVIAGVELFQIFLEVHQKSVIIQLVKTNVTTGTQLAVQRRK
ncbi:hypothetical protein D3C85_1511670 [compost metagenome]